MSEGPSVAIKDSSMSRVGSDQQWIEFVMVNYNSVQFSSVQNMSQQIKRQCVSHVHAEFHADSDTPRALEHC